MPAISTDVIPSWFKALFAGTVGDVDLISLDGETVSTRDPAAVLAFADQFGEADIDLKTTEDAAGFAFKQKPESAEKVWDVLPPSLVVRDGDGLLHSIYLLCAFPDDSPSREDVIEDILSEYPEASTCVPLPIGTCSASAEDIAAVTMAEGTISRNGDIPIYTTAAIKDAFLVDVVVEQAAAETPAQAKAEPVDSRFNDAELIHAELLDAAFLERPIKISMGVNSNAKIWKTPPATWQSIFDLLSHHEEGKKDGLAITQGYTPSGAREKAKMSELYFAGLDIDCGIPVKFVIDKLTTMKTLAIVYTTHSHMGTSTTINKNEWIKWRRDNGYEQEDIDNASQESIAGFMQEKKRFTDTLAQTAISAKSIEGSAEVVVTHGPMERFRVILPLSEPYVIDKQRRLVGEVNQVMTPREAQERWMFKMLGIAELLNITIDKKCTDPSRLFYLPRHGKGVDGWRIAIVGGAPLDLAIVPERNPRAASTESNPFLRIAEEQGARMSENLITPKGTSLRTWAKQLADGFQITRVFERYCDDAEHVVKKVTENKWEVRCPYWEGHSSTHSQDGLDHGNVIIDAASPDCDGGFVWHCQHDSCSGRDRLTFMCKAIEDGWFPETVLYEDEFNDVILRDDAPPPAASGDDDDDDEALASQEEARLQGKMLQKTLDEISAFTKAADIKEVESAVTRMVINGASPLTIETKLEELATLTKFKPAQLNKVVVQAKKQIKHKKIGHDELLAQFLRKHKIRRKADGPTMLLINAMDYRDAKEATVKAFSEHNMKHPTVFRFSEDRARVTMTSTGRAEIKALSRPVMRDAFDRGVILWKDNDGNPEKVILPEDLSDNLIQSPDVQLPELRGFMTQPYYSASGKLITERGYDPESRYMLRLPVDYEMPRFVLNPSVADVDKAKHEILGTLFADFPFWDGGDDEEGTASRAHLLAMLLLQIVAPMLSTSLPFTFITKPMRGTGATLLVESAMTIATGERVGGLNAKGEDSDIEKMITTKFHNASPVLWVDNVNRRLDSPVWNNLATLAFWEDRILGGNTLGRWENRMQVIFSGIAVQMSEEVARRCVPIGLKYPKGDPLKRGRDSFTIPGDLRLYVRENQKDLFGHCLTLVNAWMGSSLRHTYRATAEKNLPMFDEWAQLMGGLLEVIGVPGFLGNRDMLQTADLETIAWKEMIYLWFKDHKLTQVKAAEIKVWYHDMDDPPEIPGVRSDEHADRRTPQFMKRLERKIDAAFEVTYQGRDYNFIMKKKAKDGTQVYWLQELQH